VLNLALASGWFAEGTTLARAARRTRDLGLETLALAVPGPVAPGRREDVRALGVAVCGVLLGGAGAADDDFDRARPAAVQAASALRAPCLVVEGGGFDRRTARDLAKREASDAPAALALHREVREEAASRAARALWRAQAEGVPLALRNGGAAADLVLDPEVAEWLLDDLPALGLFLDPARALRARRLGLGPEPEVWADRFAARTRGVFVHGLGSDLAGGSHPEDVAPDWGTLSDALPRGAPWVIDVTHALSAADVEDVVRYLRSETGD